MSNNSKDAAVLVIISFIVVVLIFGSTCSRFVQARPVFGPAGEKKCTYDYTPFLPKRSCCWIDTDTEAYKKFCEVCTYQPDGSYGDCKTTEGPVAFKPPTTTNPPVAEQGPSSPPPPNALIQPSTICSDGSTPDANGNCPSSNNLKKTTPDQNLGSNNNNNIPQGEHHHKSKGSDLLGQEPTSKKGDNNGGGSGSDQGTITQSTP